MNAPVSMALLMAHAAMPAPSPFKQPQLEPGTQLLKLGYLHGELYLDLYGHLDEDGYEVEAATLTGNPVNLAELFSHRELGDMSAWCDRNLPTARELLLVSQQESRIDRLEWERSCG